MDIVKKTGLERIVKRHHASTDKIQPIVDELVKEGLTIGTDELRDLSDKCALLYREAENMAKKESFRIKIAFKRDKDYAETVGSLNALIDRCASSLKKVLGYHTINPLEIDAFCIENGKVIVSHLWFDEKNREYTIEPTEQRDLAKNLVDDLKKAIDNLNAYVANNPAFGKGLTSFADNRRCLCWIDEDGEFHEEIENYEFI